MVKASGRFWACSIVIAIYRVPGSNPPEDMGNRCDSTHIRPVVAIPETPTTGATQTLLAFLSGLQGMVPPSIVQKGLQDLV